MCTRTGGNPPRGGAGLAVQLAERLPLHRGPKPTGIWLLAGLSVSISVQAHLVVWPENPDGQHRENPLHLTVGKVSLIKVTPTSGELCTVYAHTQGTNRLVQPNPRVLAEVQTSPAREVQIWVSVYAEGVSQVPALQWDIYGDWEATGLPANQGCDATNYNGFKVPVLVAAANLSTPPTMPRLYLEIFPPSGSQGVFVVHWPTNASAGFVLQTTPVLLPNSVWTPIAGSTNPVGNNFIVIIGIAPTANGFFRLAK